jgi:predicted aldo/keto reductase-like oxidoreductase
MTSNRFSPRRDSVTLVLYAESKGESTMRNIPLGRTGLMMAELGFGGIPIIPLSLEDGAAVVRHCFERGITFFDTANLYADSEKKIGLALEDVRDRVVIATKTAERGADEAARHIALSLENLRTDRIDLYQLHNVSQESDWEAVKAPDGALAAAREAQAKGRIRSIGFTSHDRDLSVRIAQSGLFDTVQIPFNFIEHEPDGPLFEAARKRDMGIIAMKPFGGGLIERVDLCVKFLRQYPDVVPIPGFASTAEADEVLAMYETHPPITDADQAAMDEIRAELGKHFCHRCGYCQPCQQGVEIVKVMMIRSQARRLSREVFIDFAQQAAESVENCIQCDECLPRCPYRLPIPDLIQEQAGIFHRVAGA